MQSLAPVDYRIWYGRAVIVVVVVLEVGYSEDWVQLTTSSSDLLVLQGCSRLLLLRPALVSSSPFDLHDGFHQERIPCSLFDIFDRAGSIKVSITLIGCAVIN